MRPEIEIIVTGRCHFATWDIIIPMLIYSKMKDNSREWPADLAAPPFDVVTRHARLHKVSAERKALFRSRMFFLVLWCWVTFHRMRRAEKFERVEWSYNNLWQLAFPRRDLFFRQQLDSHCYIMTTTLSGVESAGCQYSCCTDFDTCRTLAVKITLNKIWHVRSSQRLLVRSNTIL